MTEKIIKWVKENKVETGLLLLILIVGAYLRLYKIDQYMTFLGDEGRDVIRVRRFLVNGDIMLIGPGTSIGDMYLGPLYYYLMAPALFLAGLSPVGPSVMVALFGIATIFFVWYVVREWFPRIFKGDSLQGVHIGALVAAGLYAISPTVIIYSRSSWNPNIMPFFALLSVYAIWKVWIEQKYNWLIVVSISLAFVLQSHYLGLLLLPTVGAFWFFSYIRFHKSPITNHQPPRRKLVKNSVYGFLAFVLLMSPLFIFDARHGWRNLDAMRIFFTERQTTVSARPWTAIDDIWPLWEQTNSRLMGAYNEGLGSAIALVLGLYLLYKLVCVIRNYFRNFGKVSAEDKSIIFLFTWIMVSLVGFGLYKQHIYDHYFGFLFATPYILVGALVGEVVQLAKSSAKSFGIVILPALVIFVFFVALENYKQNPLHQTPNSQYGRSVAVSEKMIEESGGEPFNIAVIAERNYEGAYQYHLERVGANFIIIDPQRANDTITTQLFVVCEYEERDECDPTHNPKTEIANFGWSKIADEWEVSGVVLYRLVHTISD